MWHVSTCASMGPTSGEEQPYLFSRSTHIHTHAHAYMYIIACHHRDPRTQILKCKLEVQKHTQNTAVQASGSSNNIPRTQPNTAKVQWMIGITKVMSKCPQNALGEYAIGWCNLEKQLLPPNLKHKSIETIDPKDSAESTICKRAPTAGIGGQHALMQLIPWGCDLKPLWIRTQILNATSMLLSTKQQICLRTQQCVLLASQCKTQAQLQEAKAK